MPVTINGTAGVTFNDSSVQGASAIGYSQTWTNVTGSRVNGTTYTNSTGKPIEVVVSSNTGASVNVQLYVNGASIQVAQPFNGANCIVSGTIPNGATYRVDLTATSIQNWYELR
jgi:hypothetical protein